MTTYAELRISNPSNFFKIPDHVLFDRMLRQDEKIKVLTSMALVADQMSNVKLGGIANNHAHYDAKDVEVALNKLKKHESVAAVYDSVSQKSRFKRIIVVTTDNHVINCDIANVAYGIAEVAGGKVFLLRIVPLVSIGADLEDPLHLLATDNTPVVESHTAQLNWLCRQNKTKVATEIAVHSGPIVQVIVNYADDCDADIIVIGSPSQSKPDALFDGPTASCITKAVSCPVLAVPASK